MVTKLLIFLYCVVVYYVWCMINLMVLNQALWSLLLCDDV